MTKILKLSKLPEDDDEAEMDVRGGGVYSKLHAQGVATLKASLQLLAGDYVHRVGIDSVYIRCFVH
jgi:hypothetical protein